MLEEDIEEQKSLISSPNEDDSIEQANNDWNRKPMHTLLQRIRNLKKIKGVDICDLMICVVLVASIVSTIIIIAYHNST